MVVIKIPLQSLAEEVRARHSLVEELFDARLESDNLVLSFRRPLNQPEQSKPISSLTEDSQRLASTRLSIEPAIQSKLPRTRRQRRARRNRTKTKGWQVVAKIVNSKGQTAIVYRPFVDALFGKQLGPAQQRAVVAEILRSNGNDPTDVSVEYFLTNTLEYISQANKPLGDS